MERSSAAAVREAEFNAGNTPTSAFFTALEGAPILASHNISEHALVLRGVGATVTLLSVAANKSVANDVAVDLFSLLFRSTELRENITRIMPQLNQLDIVIDAIRAEYFHPDYGLVVLEGSLPPPPPFAPPPPAMPPILTAEAAAQTTVSAVIGVALGSAVAGSIGGAVAASAASASAAAAGSAAAGSASSSTATTASSGASAGGVMPLVFGAQRFGASAGIAANKSDLQSDVAGSLGWISGEFGLFSGGNELEDRSASSRIRRRLAIAKPLADFTYEINVRTFNSARHHWWQARRFLQIVEEDDEDEEGEELVVGADGRFEGSPDALTDLFDGLTTFAIAFCVVGLLNVFFHFYWKNKMNTPYYAQLLQYQLPDKPRHSWKYYVGLEQQKHKDDVLDDEWADEMKLKEEEEARVARERRRKERLAGEKTKKPKKEKTAGFIAYPGIFVFPSLQTITCTFFMSGLVGTSCELLATCTQYTEANQAACMAPGALVLTAVVCVLLFCLSQIMHFWINFHHCWVPMEDPDDVEDVEDPLYRWVSKMRVRLARIPVIKLICRKSGRFTIIDRNRGEFVRKWENLREPERTERLLRNPIRFYRRCASDALDCLKLVMMNRASGFGIYGILYDYWMLMVQLIVAGLTGIGPVLEPGTWSADAQVISIFTVQLGTMAFLWGRGPSVDRIDNLIMGCQYAFEGSQTLLIYLGMQPRFEDGQSNMQMAAFFIALGGMALPIVEKGYDAIIVQLSKIFRKDEFSWAACGFAMIGLILTIPALLAEMVGLELGDGDVEGMLDETMGAMETAMEDIAEGMAAAAAASQLADLASNQAYLKNPTPQHHRSAMKLQRHQKRKLLSRQAKEHAAAAKMQAATRGKETRRKLKAEMSLAKDWRDAKDAAETSGATGSLDDAKSASMSWLEQQEKGALRDERLGRAREEFRRRTVVRAREVQELRAQFQRDEMLRQSQQPTLAGDLAVASGPPGTDSEMISFPASEDPIVAAVNQRAGHRITIAVSAGSNGNSGVPLSLRAQSFSRAKHLRNQAEVYQIGRARQTMSRDNMHDIAGILYTRANPKKQKGGAQGTEELRQAALRMKKRVAVSSLPLEMPPQISLFRAATLADIAYMEEHAEYSSSDSDSDEEANEVKKSTSFYRKPQLAKLGEADVLKGTMKNLKTSRWHSGDDEVQTTMSFASRKERLAYEAEQAKKERKEKDERALMKRAAKARKMLPSSLPPTVETPGVQPIVAPTMVFRSPGVDDAASAEPRRAVNFANLTAGPSNESLADEGSHMHRI